MKRRLLNRAVFLRIDEFDYVPVIHERPRLQRAAGSIESVAAILVKVALNRPR